MIYPSATLGAGEYLKHPGHGAGVQDIWLGVYIAERTWRKTRTCLVFFYAGYSYQRARLYRVISPFLVNRTSMTGTGQLPRLEEDMYRTAETTSSSFPRLKSLLPIFTVTRDTFLQSPSHLLYSLYSVFPAARPGSSAKDTRGT